MYTEYDPQHEAEAAMKRAAEAEGADRQRLIQLALAWHELARDLHDEQAGHSHRAGRRPLARER
ncbi:hypothetical protein XF30_20805 [Bradyrhizobium sp. SUTN9-2]|uniref:hypothetical protein n=1 Tax=Bradyrhizobium sp. SUTN9-2 TaxID=1167456 RepID=UPI000D6533AB|nr:hypothetical protein [Bradyrhizobium sp. SUTN9-2]PWE78816.1 hypothetical protein XF30_20805 [Bradyrhizobium sp. SUTN9-2]